jgi:tRNA threonylcarbamoyladenosine biosynthesis protein TsaE
MKKPQEFTTQSEQETIETAKRFAKSLKPGSVVSLRGNLGSGKTTFIKGIALGLGLKNPDEVKSPTFALMHIYQTRPPVYHFDLYRLETAAEIANIGFEEFVNDPGAVTCVEWGERAQELLPASSIAVELEAAGPTTRRIRILA